MCIQFARFLYPEIWLEPDLDAAKESERKHNELSYTSICIKYKRSLYATENKKFILYEYIPSGRRVEIRMFYKLLLLPAIKTINLVEAK